MIQQKKKKNVVILPKWCRCWRHHYFVFWTMSMSMMVISTLHLQHVSAIRLCQPFQKVRFWKYQFVLVEVDVDKDPSKRITSSNMTNPYRNDDTNGNGLTISFFAFPTNEDGTIVDPTDDWGMANMGSIYGKLKDIKMKAWYDYDNSTTTTTGFEKTMIDSRTNKELLLTTPTAAKTRTSCSIMIPGYHDIRHQARAYCDGIIWPPNSNDVSVSSKGIPKYLGIRVGYSKVKVELCPDVGSSSNAIAIAASSSAASSSTNQIQLQAQPPPPKGDNKQLSVALCVRSFQSTFFGTNEIAIKPYHVINWLSYHINIGFTKFYLYERVKDDLKNYLEPYLQQNPQHRQYIDLVYIPYMTNTTKLFTHLVTQAYVFDQIMTMQSCFSKARSEGYDLVLHIDYDEYVHTKTPQINIFETFYYDLERNTQLDHSSVALERCNIRNVQRDPPVHEVNLKTKTKYTKKKKKRKNNKKSEDDDVNNNYKHECLWGKNDNNVKSAFNVTHMKLKGQLHNVHVYMGSIMHFSKDLYLTHLPDMYVPRTHSSLFMEFLHLPSNNDTSTTIALKQQQQQQQQQKQEKMLELQQQQGEPLGVMTTTTITFFDEVQNDNMLVTKMVGCLLVGSLCILKLFKLLCTRRKKKTKRIMSSDSLSLTNTNNNGHYHHNNHQEKMSLFSRRAGRTNSSNR